MAELVKSRNDFGYFKITFAELVALSGTNFRPCGQCLHVFSDGQEITLIPVLNDVYCQACADQVLAQLLVYPEALQKTECREDFYQQYFNQLEVNNEKIDD